MEIYGYVIQDFYLWIGIPIILLIVINILGRIISAVRPLHFGGKVVLITGGSSGIGEHLAYAFSRLGASLILSARRVSELNRVKSQCAHPELVDIFPLDLSDPQQVYEQALQYASQLERLDILINNGGVSTRALFLDTNFDIACRVMNINCLSTIALTKAFLPLMIKQKSGHIVATSSLSGLIGVALRSTYCASKHAINGFFSSLSVEIAQYGINVTVVCPGYIKTDVSKNALRGDGSNFGVTDDDIENGLPVEYCVKKVLMGIRDKRALVTVATLAHRIIIPILRFCPQFYFNVGKRIFTKRIKAGTTVTKSKES